jgi:ABC-type sugar transport system ATPase subunit
MVFQNYALYPHMTVAQNLNFPLRLSGMKRPEREERIRRTARMLGIETYLDRRPAGFPAASGSASPWAVRWCASRRSS